MRQTLEVRHQFSTQQLYRVAFLGSSRTRQVEGLTLLSPAEGLEAPDLREFLAVLATSALQSFTWNFCGLYTSGLQREARLAVSEGLGHLISTCPSLKKLMVFHDERYMDPCPWPELADITSMATQRGVCFRSPHAQLRKHVRLRQVWLRPSLQPCL